MYGIVSYKTGRLLLSLKKVALSLDTYKPVYDSLCKTLEYISIFFFVCENFKGFSLFVNQLIYFVNKSLLDPAK